jgi:hypothetical protein
MRSIQNLESCRDDKKRALSCVALKKEGPKRKHSSLWFLPPAPADARPALEGKICKARTEGGRAASYRENFQIRKAFGTGSAFISLAETIQSIRGFGEPKNKVERLSS